MTNSGALRSRMRGSIGHSVVEGADELFDVVGQQDFSGHVEAHAFKLFRVGLLPAGRLSYGGLEAVTFGQIVESSARSQRC